MFYQNAKILGADFQFHYGAFEVVEGKFGVGFIPGLIAVLVMVAIVLFIIHNTDKKFKNEYALNNKAKETATK